MHSSGWSRPPIAWPHNGYTTTLQTMYYISTSIPEIDSDGCGFIVTASLVIFPLMEESYENVICSAGISPSDISAIGEEVPEDMHETSLSLLGGCGLYVWCYLYVYTIGRKHLHHQLISLSSCIRKSKRPHAYLDIIIVFPNRIFNQTLYLMVTNASRSVVGTEGSLIVH